MDFKELKATFESIKIKLLNFNEVESFAPYLELLPKESMGWSKGRETKFLAGRLCAQLDLENLEFISRGQNQEPLFKKGHCGSISHSKDFAIAARTYQSLYRSLGIDIERVVTDKKMFAVIQRALTKSEVELLEKYDDHLTHRAATIMFSAKESLYKMINPLAQVYINFHEGIIESIDFEKGLYSIRLESETQELQKYCGTYHGEFFSVENNIVTLCVYK